MDIRMVVFDVDPDPTLPQQLRGGARIFSLVIDCWSAAEGGSSPITAEHSHLLRVVGKTIGKCWNELDFVCSIMIQVKDDWFNY